MLYSRPNITPLGWDLSELPQTEDGINYEAKTSSGDLVKIRFKGGWLSVHLNSEERLAEQHVSPNQFQNLLPEQICDILGLTVHGSKVIVPPEKLAQELTWPRHSYDLSGTTTYWISRHRILEGEMRKILKAIVRRIPDAVILHLDLEKRKVSRERFWKKNNKRVTVGFHPDKNKLKALLRLESIFSSEFMQRLPFSCILELSEWDLKRDLVTEKRVQQLKSAGISVEIPQTRLDIYGEYLSEDPFGKKAMDDIQEILKEWMHSRVEVFDLVQKTTIRKERGLGYSKNLRDWCLENNDRYLTIGIETDQNRSGSDWKPYASDGTLYYGRRPEK